MSLLKPSIPLTGCLSIKNNICIYLVCRELLKPRMSVPKDKNELINAIENSYSKIKNGFE